MAKRASSSRRRKKLPRQLQRLNLNAAGIDVGATSHFVAVPPDRTEKPVREFGAFTIDLHGLADWLKECEIETVVLESTGVYWIPLFELLESRGFEILLVDAYKLKCVPGRKTDVQDCQWLQELHTYGLLTAAFRPDDQICVLRSYLRQRARLVQYGSHHIQHMQKALTQMNVKLQHVVSDIMGVTGLAIIQAILDGERSPVKLAQLRDRRCKRSEEIIAKALHGNWREEHLFELEQALSLWRGFQDKITECDRRIEACLKTFEDRSEGKELPKRPRTTGRRHNEPTFDLRTHLFRISGVDLTDIDGIEAHTATTIVSEIGLDMTRWSTSGHFASWLGLCPGNKISAGKRLSRRSKKCINRVATALRLAAWTLHHSTSALGAYYRRMNARLGPPKAITATAHKLARIVYWKLKYRQNYVDPGAHYYERAHAARVKRNVQRRARSLGYELVPLDEAPSQLPAT